MSLLAAVLHLATMLAAAPGVPGLIGKLRARLAGRVGPPVVQPYRDLARLFRKQLVRAEAATPIFDAAPLVALAASIVAAALVPSFTAGTAFAPLGDMIVIAGLLGLARAALVLGAMDAGTAFGGIGASRTTAFAVFAEPALLLVILTLALLAGSTSLDAITTMLREGVALRVALGFALVAVVASAIAASGRLPVADPATPRELAMAHAALTLEYSGPPLALIEFGAALRLLVWLSLICAIFVPFGMASPTAGLAGWLVGLAAWAAKILVLAVALAGLEATIGRMRLRRVPELLSAAVLLALLAALFLFVTEGFA